MKNLSVRMKLVFLIAVSGVLMAAFGIITLVTSTSRNDQLNRLNSLTDYQQEMRTANSNLLNARIELRTVYTDQISNDGSYDKATSLINQSVTDFNSAAEINSKRLKGEFDSEQTGILDTYNKVLEINSSINNSNLKIIQLSEDAKAAGSTMTESINSFSDFLETNLSSAYESGDPAVYAKAEDFLHQGNMIANAVNSLRINGRTILLRQDISVIPEVQSDIDNVSKLLDGLSSSATSEKARQAINSLRDALNNYNKSVDSIVTEVRNGTELISSARTYMDNFAATADNLVSTIDGTVTVTLNEIISSSVVITYSMLAAFAFAIVLSIALGIYISKSITVPLSHMVKWMNQAGQTGDLFYADEEWRLLDDIASGKDEVAQCVGTYGSLIRQIEYYGEVLTTIANRDLTVYIKTLGDNDTIGNALVNMMSELNNMLGEIKLSSEQVTTGASQIADGAQSLAQGSTQQAAAVQELSSSINEVAVKTQENARLASKAADLSSNIRQSAHLGTERMDQLMQAMREINEASNNISNVVQVIDNIAFQTNILALNAAVEAARVGQHGKGFTVVAEEVRALAAKSTEAAKETGSMIERSLEKAALGVRIADETSASLTEIVTGINESTEIVMDISRSSDEQSGAIKQINIGVDQVAQVVQQNSATAEQSAAAAQEMSGQSSIMNELVGRFKIRGMSNSLNSAKKPAALPKNTHFSSSSSYNSAPSIGSDDSFGKY